MSTEIALSGRKKKYRKRRKIDRKQLFIHPQHDDEAVARKLDDLMKVVKNTKSPRLYSNHSLNSLSSQNESSSNHFYTEDSDISTESSESSTTDVDASDESSDPTSYGTPKLLRSHTSSDKLGDKAMNDNEEKKGGKPSKVSKPRPISGRPPSGRHVPRTPNASSKSHEHSSDSKHHSKTDDKHGHHHQYGHHHQHDHHHKHGHHNQHDHQQQHGHHDQHDHNHKHRHHNQHDHQQQHGDHHQHDHNHKHGHYNQQQDQRHHHGNRINSQTTSGNSNRPKSGKERPQSGVTRRSIPSRKDELLHRHAGSRAESENLYGNADDEVLEKSMTPKEPPKSSKASSRHRSDDDFLRSQESPKDPLPPVRASSRSDSKTKLKHRTSSSELNNAKILPPISNTAASKENPTVQTSPVPDINPVSNPVFNVTPVVDNETTDQVNNGANATSNSNAEIASNPTSQEIEHVHDQNELPPDEFSDGSDDELKLVMRTQDQTVYDPIGSLPEIEKNKQLFSKTVSDENNGQTAETKNFIENKNSPADLKSDEVFGEASTDTNTSDKNQLHGDTESKSSHREEHENTNISETTNDENSANKDVDFLSFFTDSNNNVSSLTENEKVIDPTEDEKLTDATENEEITDEKGFIETNETLGSSENAIENKPTENEEGSKDELDGGKKEEIEGLEEGVENIDDEGAGEHGEGLLLGSPNKQNEVKEGEEKDGEENTGDVEKDGEEDYRIEGSLFGESSCTGEQPTEKGEEEEEEETITIKKPKWHPPWQLKQEILAHSDAIPVLMIDPTNRWFATGSNDKTIRMWDINNGRQKLVIKAHKQAVRAMTFGTAGHRHLYSSGDDRQLLCHDVEINRVVSQFKGQSSVTYSACIHQPTGLLVCGGRDKQLKFFDPRTTKCVKTLRGHQNTVSCVVACDNTQQVISGSHDSTLRIWDIGEGKCVNLLQGHNKSVRAVTKHPDHDVILSASSERILAWSLPSGEAIQEILAEDIAINSVTVNSLGVCVAGGSNGTIHMWDFESAHCFQKVARSRVYDSQEIPICVFATKFDHTGTKLICSDACNVVKIYREAYTRVLETRKIFKREEI